MKKLIDISDSLNKKLKIISAFENASVKALIEKAVALYVTQKEKEHYDNLSEEEKEDLGLLLLMQQVDKTDIVSEEEFLKSFAQ